MWLTTRIKITKLLQKNTFHDQNLKYTFKKDNYPFKELSHDYTLILLNLCELMKSI